MATGCRVALVGVGGQVAVVTVRVPLAAAALALANMGKAMPAMPAPQVVLLVASMVASQAVGREETGMPPTGLFLQQTENSVTNTFERD